MRPRSARRAPGSHGSGSGPRSVRPRTHRVPHQEGPRRPREASRDDAARERRSPDPATGDRRRRSQGAAPTEARIARGGQPRGHQERRRHDFRDEAVPPRGAGTSALGRHGGRCSGQRCRAIAHAERAQREALESPARRRALRGVASPRLGISSASKLRGRRARVPELRRPATRARRGRRRGRWSGSCSTRSECQPMRLAWLAPGTRRSCLAGTGSCSLTAGRTGAVACALGGAQIVGGSATTSTNR